jgi:hypothetical protein
VANARRFDVDRFQAGLRSIVAAAVAEERAPRARERTLRRRQRPAWPRVA